MTQGCSPPKHGTVQIVNAADAPVSGEVEVAGYKFNLDRLPTGDSVTFHFDVDCGECDYHVMVSLGAVRRLDKHVGYLDYAFDSDDRIIIRPNDVEIEDLSPRPTPTQSK